MVGVSFEFLADTNRYTPPGCLFYGTFIRAEAINLFRFPDTIVYIYLNLQDNMKYHIRRIHGEKEE